MTSTGRPICVHLEACLFGIGLTYLLLSWRSASTFVVLATIGMSIFLGSVLLPTPPSYYHYFVAMVFVAFISAVACDRLLALTDSWSWKPRLVCAPLAAGVLIAICFSHIDTVWRFVRRTLPGEAGGSVYSANSDMIAARFIRKHPGYRHYLVRSPKDDTCRSSIFLFASADSDFSDLTTDLVDTLPVPPAEPAADVSILILSSRRAERDVVTSFYPNAVHSEARTKGGRDRIWFYVVDAETIRRVYAAHQPRDDEEATAGARSTGKPG